jgi:hypothetical protein
MTHWLEKHMGTCDFKAQTGMDCPGCGMQRAIIELLKGNIWDSIQIYPALIPLIITFSLLITHLIFHLKHGAKILKIAFITTSSIIVISYLIKILTHYKFSF